MYRNVSLRRRSADGRPTWTLLGPDGRRVAAFDAFAYALRNEPLNTVEAYCRHLAEFVDFLVEATVLIAKGEPLSKLQLTEAIEAYGDYLRYGTAAGKQIARDVAGVLRPKANAPASVVPKKAAIRRFLRLSEDVRKEMAELARLRGKSDATVDDTPLLPELGKRRELQSHEVHAMQATSMLAGVIPGGPRLIEALAMDDGEDSIPYDERRAFPYDKVSDLIEAAPSFLDKTQYALLAASGCRTHEGLQLLMEDIDVLEGTVRLVAPTARLGHPSYRALTSEQRGSLAWKGRTTELTLLIEPFASMFFESLQKYLEREYIAHGLHDFLFQYRGGIARGMPYFLSDASTRLERFHKLCRQVGVVLPRGTGPHSLRHTYGTYLVNYFPRTNGTYGLPLPEVQQLMGHAEMKSTQRYARRDKDLLKLEIESANRVLFKNGSPKKLMELKVEALEAQLLKLRMQIGAGAIGHD